MKGLKRSLYEDYVKMNKIIRETAPEKVLENKEAAYDAAIRAVIHGATKTTGDRYIVDGPALRELANLLLG